MIDNVQNYDSYINTWLSETYRSYLQKYLILPCKLDQFSSFYMNMTYRPKMMDRLCLMNDSFCIDKKYICV
jgi:hypothetical protein